MKNRSCEAVVTGTALIKGEKVALGIMDSNFIMASMGTVVVEKSSFVQARQLKKNYQLYCLQHLVGTYAERVMSLMQMAKISTKLNVIPMQVSFI